MQHCGLTHSRRRNWILPGFACAAVLLIAACQKPDESAAAVTIEHEIAPQPARVGTITITLKLSDPSGKAITGARIGIEGNMSHAGMSPAFGEAKEITAGRYQAPLELSMGGDWIVLVRITLSDGQRLERQFEIKGVRSD